MMVKKYRESYEKVMKSYDQSDEKSYEQVMIKVMITIY